MTQKKPKKFLPYLVACIILFYLGDILYSMWVLAPESTNNLDIFKTEKLKWIVENFSIQSLLNFSFSSFALLCGLVLAIIPLFMYLKVQDNGVYRDNEEHGSAKFATKSEMSSFEDKEPDMNMIFTQNAKMGLINKRLPYNRQLNKNTLVVGLPGDGKTFTYVKPNIMQMNSSYVVTDPKGLLVHEVGSMLENNGYKIKVFDLVHLSNSDTFNMFNYMNSELDIDRMTESIVEGTKKSDNQGEDFWVQAQLMLMRALIGYLYFDSQIKGFEYEPNLSQVADLLRNIQRDENNEDIPSPVERMFEKLEDDIGENYACRQWELFNSNFKSETRTSVLATTSATFAVFDHEDVTKMISKDTMDIESWNKEKTAVFIAIPETNKAFNFLSSLMFAVMFEVLTHSADDVLQGKVEGRSSKDLLHVQLIIDEFANIGRIPNFNEVLASVRSREISVKIIIQAINQLESLYKNDWKTIFNNCAIQIFLGTNDETTMKYFSTRAGKQTITIKNNSVTNQGTGRSGSSSQSTQKLQRDLMTPDEVARIGVDEGLVFITKQNVFRDKKASVLEHKRKDELANSSEDTTWYDYKRYMSDIDEWKESVQYENRITLTDADLDAIKIEDIIDFEEDIENEKSDIEDIIDVDFSDIGMAF